MSTIALWIAISALTILGIAIIVWSCVVFFRIIIYLRRIMLAIEVMNRERDELEQEILDGKKRRSKRTRNRRDWRIR